MSARPSVLFVVALATLPLGCGGRAEFYVDPAKYQLYNCDQMRRDIKPLIERARELKALYDKAARDDAGVLIGRVSYEADYLTTTGNIRLIEAEARDKNCDPPIAAGPIPPLR